MAQVMRSVDDVNGIRRELEETKAALSAMRRELEEAKASLGGSRRELQETKATLARKTAKVCALQEEIRDLSAGIPAAARPLPFPVIDYATAEVPRPDFDVDAAARMIVSMNSWVERESGQHAPESVGKLTDWLVDVVDCL